jgi:small subunit ribosomal protein S8
MAVSDPVADFLTCVRNAIRAKHRKVDVNASRVKTEIAKVLLRERFINNFKVIEDTKQGVLRIYLKYTGEDVNVITGIRRISMPGRRLYVDVHHQVSAPGRAQMGHALAAQGHDLARLGPLLHVKALVAIERLQRQRGTEGGGRHG